MPARRDSPPDKPQSRRRRATTPEAREQELIAAAHDLAEQQIRDGTASAQVITHFLKLGSTRERLEQLRLEGEVTVLSAKAEQMANGGKQEELYNAALNAMRAYSGQPPLEIPDVVED